MTVDDVTYHIGGFANGESIYKLDKLNSSVTSWQWTKIASTESVMVYFDVVPVKINPENCNME